LALAIVLIAGLVRLLASRDQFWLDEIWSWQFAREAKSYWQIATGLPHDNNQILNTWILYSFPRNVHWSIYRIPAVIAGIGTVILAGLCGLQRSKIEAMLALILTGTSFVCIQYSSEARGYAYLLFFIFLCLWLMQRITRTPSVRDEFVFALSASLGFLSHFLFACAFAGFGVWSLVFFTTRSQRVRDSLWPLARMLTLPLLIASGLTYCYQAKLMSGGGDKQDLPAVIIESASLSIGGPNAGIIALVCALAAILALMVGTLVIAREHDGRFLFVSVSILALALMIVLSGSNAVYVRYLLIPIATVLIVVSHLLARLWSVSVLGKIATAAVVLGIVIGNSLHTWGLLEYGRGGYLPALAYMQAESKQRDLSIGSDHDFRNSLILGYYYPWLRNPKPLHYHPMGQWPSEGPEWLIQHVIEPESDPQWTFIDGNQNQFQLVAIFPHSGLSGFTWLIYHRLPKDRR
jgi:hypothetical protein